MTVSRPAAVVILAAGAGTRMKSQLPKVLHPICGASMLDHVLAAARELGPAELIVVIGHGRRQVAAHLARHAPDVRAVVQDRQGGTGHAVRTVAETVGLGLGTVVVTYGDTPLLRGSATAVLRNPYAGRYVADIQPMMEALKPLGREMAARLVEALGGAGRIEAYGKGALVGLAGELEHSALWHVPGGYGEFGDLATHLRYRRRG